MAAEERIAILGLRGSGKSTFLSVLNLAFDQRNSPWRIRPVDGSTADYWFALSNSIFAEGFFPEPTSGEAVLAFWVEKGPTMLGLQPGRRFRLYLADVPGEAVRGILSPYERFHDFYEESVKGCSGVIFLLDPQEIWRGGEAVSRNSDVYYPLFRSMLTEIKFQAAEDVFIAFCITKIDSILQGESDFALHGVMQDVESLAERIIGRNTKSWIDRTFDSDHISWFPVSSIGYSIEGNQRTTQLVERVDNGGSIRPIIKNPSLLTPIGVAQPLEWVLDSITRYSGRLDAEEVGSQHNSAIARFLRRLLDR